MHPYALGLDVSRVHNKITYSIWTLILNFEEHIINDMTNLKKDCLSYKLVL